MDEYTKNHCKKDRENLSGFVPEMPGSESCLVQSYLKYVSKLNPNWVFGKGQGTPFSMMTLGLWIARLVQNLCPNSRQSLAPSAHFPKRIQTTAFLLLEQLYCRKQVFVPPKIISVTGHKSLWQCTSEFPPPRSLQWQPPSLRTCYLRRVPLTKMISPD